MAKQITDFGEKIGGAKKDLWKGRGLDVTDLESITDRELNKFVTKDNIYPTPDYVELVNNGMDPVCAYYIREVRTKCGAKLPDTATREDAERFISFLTDLKEVSLETLTQFDAMNFFNRLFVQKGYYVGGYNGWTDRAKSTPGLDNKLVKFAQLGSSSFRWEKFVAEAKLQNFPYNFDGDLKGKTIRFIDGKGYCLGKSYRVLSPFFETEAELREYLKTEKEKGGSKKDTSKGGSKQIVRPQLAHITRNGPNARQDKDITGEDLLETYKFRGGEFGNWNTQDDRQACLNYSYDALWDLAYVLDIPLEGISSCGGDTNLAIAFGARGAGNASAHFEPSRVVINLTKLKGAGSLAHEWGHFLDLELAILCGGSGKKLLTEIRLNESNQKHPNVYKALKHVMDVIKQRPMSTEEYVAHYESTLERYKKNLKITLKNNSLNYYSKATDEQVAHFDQLCDAVVENPTVAMLEKVFEYYREVRGKVMPKADRDEIEMRRKWCEDEFIKVEAFKLNPKPTTDLVTQTNYVAGAKALDANSSKAYFSQNAELFARAFECFVSDSLGFKSQYLVYGVSNSHYMDKKPYPEGEERKKINQAFRQLFEVIKAEIFKGNGFNPRQDIALQPPKPQPSVEQPSKVVAEPTQPKDTSNKYLVTTTAELRKLIAAVPTKIPQGDAYTVATHAKSLTNKLKANGVHVTLGTVNPKDCTGMVKSYIFANGNVTLDKQATPEKQLQGLIEAYILTVGHQKGGHLAKNIVIEGGIYALCKGMGLDVRIYCMSARFNQLLNNPVSCESYLTTLEEYFK